MLYFIRFIIQEDATMNHTLRTGTVRLPFRFFFLVLLVVIVVFYDSALLLLEKFCSQVT